MRLRWLTSILVVTACHCGDRPDEEVLAERIDSTSVHLFVAAKVALGKADDDPAVTAARNSLISVLSAAQALQRRANAVGVTTEGATGGTTTGGATEGTTTGGAAPDETEPEVATLSAGDLITLASALYEMRETGAEIVRSGSEDDLAPLLPVLLGMTGFDPLSQQINLSTDHAVFFVGLWVLKVHPRFPTPVPQEILLYEASRIDPSSLAFPGMDLLVHGLRSYTYATNDLCDLAKRDADALDALANSDLVQLFTHVGAAPLTESQSDDGIAGLQALAHGSTAYCFFGRDEGNEAREELEHFVSAAERAGASPADLGLVRAYLAYHDNDLAGARTQLALAKEADWMTKDRREDIDELIEHLDRENTDFLDSYFDRVFFARFAAELVLREAEQAGLFDSVQETGAFRSVSGFLRTTSGALASGTEEVQGAADDAAERASDLWNKVRGE